ncbi:hypothetical protein FO519_010445, partial [Halicephalobus sp. NKZ332]
MENFRRTSILDLSHEERNSIVEKLKDTVNVNQLTLPDGKPQHKKSGFLGKIRKSKDENGRKKSKMDDKHEHENGNVSRSGSKDALNDMPTSGPGRQGTTMRTSLKKKKRKETNPNIQVPPGLIAASNIPDRRPSMCPPEMIGDGTQIADDTYGMIALSDRIDEYYYGVRIFPGQDPANVWIGWVTPQYHAHSTTFNVNEA